MKTAICGTGVKWMRVRRMAVASLVVLAGAGYASSAGPPRIADLTPNASGRMTLKIIPAGDASEVIDVFSTDSLTSGVWNVAGPYLQPEGQSQMLWDEPADVPEESRPRSRFFRVGRADIDLNENGIPDDREAWTAVSDLPPGCRARWARAGLGGAPTNYTTVLNVKTYGAKGNGSNDDTGAINTTLSKASSGSVVYLPAGTYRLTQPIYLKSNMILRGDGAALTSLIFEGSGTADRCIGLTCWDSDQTTSYATVTGGMSLDSTEVTVSSVSGFGVGDIVEMEEDNDPSWGFTDSWQLRLPGQMNRVTKVDAANKRLSLDRPLRHTFSAARNPRIRKLVVLSNIGIENLFVRRKDSVVGYTIEMKYVARCWVRGVESYMTYKAHIWMERAYECEVRESFFHDAFVFGGDGQGYGVGCGKRTSDCLIENNIFYHLRHSMIVGIGANGNVYGYNTSAARALDPVYGTPQADISVHGNYVFMNLFEGNVLEDADVPDWYWPAGPGNTLFRNRISNGGTAINVGSNNQNFLGNVLPNGTITLAKSLSGIVDYDNVTQGNAANAVETEKASSVLPDSLYRCVPPAFIRNAAGVSWPPIGPEKPVDSATPSALRYLCGDCVP